jgi:hypothetical protein
MCRCDEVEMLLLFVKSPARKSLPRRFDVVRRLTPDEAVVEKQRRPTNLGELPTRLSVWKSDYNNRLAIEQARLSNYLYIHILVIYSLPRYIACNLFTVYLNCACRNDQL